MTARNIQKIAQEAGIKRSSPQAQASCVEAFIERPLHMAVAWSLSNATFRGIKTCKDSERCFTEYTLEIPVDETAAKRCRRDMTAILQKSRAAGARKIPKTTP
jgi:hypothetical protein